MLGGAGRVESTTQAVDIQERLLDKTFIQRVSQALQTGSHPSAVDSSVHEKPYTVNQVPPLVRNGCPLKGFIET